MTLSLVIPTKNRPQDLVQALKSILAQTRLPDELLIIDQSPDQLSKNLSEDLFSRAGFKNIRYVHDVRIKGLVHAKKRGTELARGSLICFLEDDVELEPEYLAQIEAGFKKNLCMVGCSGIITNPSPDSKLHKFIFQIFHRGIFKDKRLMVYGQYSGWNHELVKSDKLSGGVSAWRADVFKEVSFNSESKFFMLEDIDFSTNVARRYGDCLYINPNARLIHHWSPVNRDLVAVRQQRKLSETIQYYRLRRDWRWAKASLLWLLIGLFFEATFKSLTTKSTSPIAHYFKGISQGLN